MDETIFEAEVKLDGELERSEMNTVDYKKFKRFCRDNKDTRAIMKVEIKGK